MDGGREGGRERGRDEAGYRDVTVSNRIIKVFVDSILGQNPYPSPRLKITPHMYHSKPYFITPLKEGLSFASLLTR